MNKSNYKKHSDIKIMCCNYSYNDKSKLDNNKFISDIKNEYNLNIWEKDFVTKNNYVNDNIKFFKRPIIKHRDNKLHKTN